MAGYSGDPYEEWKQQGRPDGSFEAWMANQANPGGAAPPQQNVAQPPPPATGAPPSSGAGGKTWNWTPDPGAAQKAWRSAGSPATGDVNAWFKNAVEAGAYLQNGESSSDTAYNKSGYSQGGADITGMRAWAKQHGMSEDFDRWDDGQLMAWEKQKDPNCPPNTPYQAYDGSGCIEKPIDSNNPQAQGGEGGGQGGPGGGPVAPPKPTTFGNQLSMTGNPMQDMLIQQFNTGQNATYQQGNNLFGLGEDRAVGGAGANADMKNGKQEQKAQSLSGGGLWWGQGDFNNGMDASQKNSEEANAVSPGFKAPKAAEPPPAAIVPQSQGNRGTVKPRVRQQGMGNMMYNQYANQKQPQNPLGQRFF